MKANQAKEMIFLNKIRFTVIAPVNVGECYGS